MVRAASFTLALLLTACSAAAPSSSESPSADATAAPATSSAPSTSPSAAAAPVEAQQATTPSAQPTPLPAESEDLLLLRVYSPEFSYPEERTEQKLADVVLFSDGVVAANVNPNTNEAPVYAAVQVTNDELAEITAQIADADLADVSIDVKDATEIGAFDALTAIILAQTDEGLVELVAPGLFTLHEPASAFPPEVVAIDKLLNDLKDRAQGGGTVPDDHEVPTVLVAPDRSITDPAASP